MPSPRTWVGTGSAVAQVGPCCPVAELVVLLLPAVGVEMADLPHLVEEAGKLDSQRSEEEAGPASSVMVVESLTRPIPRCPLGWVPC
jgi:hypothetical protein